MNRRNCRHALDQARRQVRALRDAEIVNVAFLAVPAGCSSRRYKCRVARPHKRVTTTQCARQCRPKMGYWHFPHPLAAPLDCVIDEVIRDAGAWSIKV